MQIAMRNPRLSLLVLLVVLITVIVTGIFYISDRSPELPAIRNESMRAQLAWKQMVRSGLRRAKARNLSHSWPFISLHKPPNGMPPHLMQEARAMLRGAGSLQLRYGDAAYARTHAGVGLWVVPGRAVICMFRAVKMGSACVTAARAQREGVVLGVYQVGTASEQPPHFTLLGVVPDGVRALKVEEGNTIRTVPVIDNSFETSARHPIRVAALER
jgi:hypothetical protein